MKLALALKERSSARLQSYGLARGSPDKGTMRSTKIFSKYQLSPPYSYSCPEGHKVSLDVLLFHLFSAN